MTGDIRGQLADMLDRVERLARAAAALGELEPWPDPTPWTWTTMADWHSLPRMLQELCDGHPGYSVEVYAFDHWGRDRRSWLCKGCWVNAWQRFKNIDPGPLLREPSPPAS